MTPSTIVKFILENSDFDPRAYVLRGGDESAVVIHDGPKARIIAPLTVYTLNDYVRNVYNYTPDDFKRMTAKGPIYVVTNKADKLPNVVKSVFLYFVEMKATNDFMQEIAWRDIPKVLDDAWPETQEALGNYFESEISKKRNGLQNVTNLVLIGRNDLAIKYRRQLGRAKLPLEMAIDASNAVRKAGGRSRNAIGRLMRNQTGVKWGEKGFFLLYSDWSDPRILDFFDDSPRHSYRKAAQDVFNGDSIDWYNPQFAPEDVWNRINSKNEALIRQLLIGRDVFTDDFEGVLTADDALSMTDSELRDIVLGKENPDDMDDIKDAIRWAGEAAERSGMESAYYDGYTRAVISAIGAGTPQWIKAKNSKGERTHLLGFFIPYSTLEEWVEEYKKEEYVEHFDGDIHELAAMYCKAEPEDDYSPEFDEDYFNEELADRLSEIKMVQPVREEPSQPELPLQGEPPVAAIEPDLPSKVSVNVPPTQDNPKGSKVYPGIPASVASKYVQAMGDKAKMTAESLVEALTEREERSAFHQPENFDCSEEGNGWRFCRGMNDWEDCYTAMAVVFPQQDQQSRRIWADIDCGRFGTGDDEHTEEAKAWGEEACKLWVKSARKLKGEKNDDGIERDWFKAFKDALADKEMAPYVKDHGIDETRWAKSMIEAEVDPKAFLKGQKKQWKIVTWHRAKPENKFYWSATRRAFISDFKQSTVFFDAGQAEANLKAVFSLMASDPSWPLRVESYLAEAAEDDPKSLLKRHPNLRNVVVKRVSYSYSQSGRATQTQNDSKEVAADEAIKWMSGDHVHVEWPDGDMEHIDFIRTPISVSGSTQELQHGLGYITMSDGKSELVKLSRLQNVAYGYYRPIHVTPEERATFKPIQNEGQSDTVSPFQQAMGDLDAALTEKDFKEATRQFHHMPKTVEEFISSPGGNPIWYLSDGGYSRVVYSLEREYLFLTDNSTSRVKARWEACKPQRNAVEQIIRDGVRRLSSEEPNE
jgi:hypothetical protein